MFTIEFLYRLTTTSKPLDKGWRLCFDFIGVAGKSGFETKEARHGTIPVTAKILPKSNLTQSEDFSKSCLIHQFPGLHRFNMSEFKFFFYKRNFRCILNCDALDANKTLQFDMYSFPYSLSMSDFYGNYYVIAPNFPVTTIIKNTKLNPEFVLPYRTDEQTLATQQRIKIETYVNVFMN